MPSEQMLELIAAKRSNPYGAHKSVEELRQESDSREDNSLLPAGTSFAGVEMNGTPGEWIDVPGARADRVVFFIHGGGYYRGNVSSTRSAAAEMGRACRARALSIGYRKAPEHPFPAAIDDVLAGYQGLLATGVSSSQVVVGGISAGGGLTAALLLALKRDGGAMPAGAVPISPWLDLTQTAETYTSKADADPSISKDYLDRMAGYYLGGADARTPLASPLFGDLTDLPPQLVQVGAAETLMDDSVAYARALGEADSPVSLEIYPGAVHGWHMSPHLPETQQAMRSIGSFFDDVVG